VQHEGDVACASIPECPPSTSGKLPSTGEISSGRLHPHEPESRIVEIVGSLVRRRALRLSVLVLAVAALSGCGSDERALKLPAVKEALHAAGLGRLHVLTQQRGYHELRSKGLFPEFTSGPAPDGPDYLQGRARPALLVIRLGKVSDASRVTKKSGFERSGALSVQATRICNVVVLDYAPQRELARSTAARVVAEVRIRCT
jgi:hypothetical protein